MEQVVCFNIPEPLARRYKTQEFHKSVRNENSFKILFMPTDQMIGGILFLSCLTVVNFNLRYNFWTVRFGMHTPLVTPFQMTPRSMTLWLTLKLEKAFWTLLPPGAYRSFHKHTLSFITCLTCKYIRKVQFYRVLLPILLRKNTPTSALPMTS